MRIRLAILIALAVLFAVVALLAIWHSSVLTLEAQQIYNSGNSTTQPTVAQQDRATLLWAQSGALSQVATPFATGALLCVTAVLGILGWRWELRVRPRAQ